MLINLIDDVILEITSYLDAVSIFRFLRTSKRLWNLKSKQVIIDRTVPYQQYIHWGQWNKGLLEATKRINYPQIVFFKKLGADDFDKPLEQAAFIGHEGLVKYFKLCGATAIAQALIAAGEGGHANIPKIFRCSQFYDSVDRKECTLIGAAKGGHLETVVSLWHKVAQKTHRSLYIEGIFCEDTNKLLISQLNKAPAILMGFLGRFVEAIWIS